MSNVTIGRYTEAEAGPDWSGYIEPADRSWIIYLDHDGKPSLYWPQRDSDGAVTGEPIQL